MCNVGGLKHETFKNITENMEEQPKAYQEKITYYTKNTNYKSTTKIINWTLSKCKSSVTKMSH